MTARKPSVSYEQGYAAGQRSEREKLKIQIRLLINRARLRAINSGDFTEERILRFAQEMYGVFNV